MNIDVASDVASAVEYLYQVYHKQPDLEPAFHLRNLSLLQHYPLPFQQSRKAFQAWRKSVSRPDKKLYRGLRRSALIADDLH